MTSKTSSHSVSNTNRIGDNLNYSLDYSYYQGTHKAERIGSRYYDYDLKGNLASEREGGHASNPQAYRPYYQDGDMYWTDYGFGLVRPEARQDDGVFQRNYKWNERNLLSESSDSVYTVQYRYGSDGNRALKFVANSGRSTVYFNKMWQASDVTADWLQSKHVYVGEERIATKYNSEGNENTQAERERTYYYHSDHLGSAQVVTNWRGQIHERLEYTPYGELWIDWKGSEAPQDGTPFRFTGKELDAETGLYYYGARYLDPKTSRWLSADPAMGEYVPQAGKGAGGLPGMGGVYNTVNLHTYHYAGNNPVKYRDPDGRISRSLSEEEWSEVNRVQDETIKYLGEMIGEIENYVSGRSDSISSEIMQGAMDWLGIDISDGSSAIGLADDLKKTRNNLASKTRNDFRVNDKADYLGLVIPFGRKIYLGPNFRYKPDVLGSSGTVATKHGTLFHEVTHFLTVLSTSDITENEREARLLAKSPRMDGYIPILFARNSAYNWEMFFQGYAQVRR